MAALPPRGSVHPLPTASPSPAARARHPSLAELPEMLTVEEAAAVLRIGRTAAYQLARRWRETGGREGLPNVALGRSLRVPRVALEACLTLAPSSGQPRADATGG
jgi:hypothetical protein